MPLVSLRSLTRAGCALALVSLGACSSPTDEPTIDGGHDAFVSQPDAANDEDASGELDASVVDAALDDAGAADTGAGDAGPILPDRDAGDPFGDAGPGGPPEWVAIDVLTDGSTCDALTACGGDEVGTWDVSGGCVEVDVPEELMACPGATVSATGRGRGRVTFDGTIAVRTAQSEVTVSVFVPGICATFVGGCSAIETMLRGSFPDSACREDAARDCNCALRQSFELDDADGYAIEGDQIVSATLGKRWDYCVEPSGSLRYRDVSSSGTTEPGIIELTRR